MRHKYKIKIETPPAESRKHGEHRKGEGRLEVAHAGRPNEERDGSRQAPDEPNTSPQSLGAAASAPERSATVREEDLGRVRKFVDELTEALAKKVESPSQRANAQGGTAPTEYPAGQSVRPAVGVPSPAAQMPLAESQKQAQEAVMEMLGTLHSLNIVFVRRLAAVHQQVEGLAAEVRQMEARQRGMHAP